MCRHDVARWASLRLGPTRPLEVEAGDGRGRGEIEEHAVVSFSGKESAPSRRNTNRSIITSSMDDPRPQFLDCSHSADRSSTIPMVPDLQSMIRRSSLMGGIGADLSGWLGFATTCCHSTFA